MNSYLELRPCRPRLERLKSLLMECPFQGLECEPEFLGEESQEGGEGEGDSAPMDVPGQEERGPMGGRERGRTKKTPNKVSKVQKNDFQASVPNYLI